MGYVDEGYEELYSDINRLGRGPQESYEALCSKSDSEVLDLFWDMYLSIREPKVQPSLFSFSPSQSLSGGRFPCADINCRLRNAQRLCNFSVMYADNVFVPFPLNDLLKEAESNSSLDRNLFFDALILIKMYEPLVRAGLLYFQPDLVTTCPSCTVHLNQIQQTFQNRFESIGSPVIQSVLNSLQVYVMKEGEEVYLKILPCPELGIQESSFIHFRYEVPSVVLSALNKDGIGASLDFESMREIGLAQQIFQEINDDLSMYNEQNIEAQCSYLTDRPSDLTVLKGMSDSVSFEDISHYRILSQLTHSIPYLANISTEKILKLRKEEGDAFDNYRSSITKAMKSVKLVTANDYRDFYRDEIQCGINNIQHAVKNAKNTYMSDALLMAGSICISVAQLGIPPELAPVASLASGALGAATVTDIIRKHRENINGTKAMGYYFLWKLNE